MPDDDDAVRAHGGRRAVVHDHDRDAGGDRIGAEGREQPGELGRPVLHRHDDGHPVRVPGRLRAARRREVRVRQPRVEQARGERARGRVPDDEPLTGQQCPGTRGQAQQAQR